MNSERQSVFRGAAPATNQAVGPLATSLQTPQFLMPRRFRLLWTLIGLLALTSMGVLFVRVPVYVTGTGVIVDWRGEDPAVPGDIAIALFVSPEDALKLQAGQSIFLRLNEVDQPIERVIVAIEPGVSSPEAFAQRFALGSAAGSITQPATVAIAAFEPAPRELPAHAYLGSHGQVDVAVGSRPIFSLLPILAPPDNSQE
jgi:hypothetical protein